MRKLVAGIALVLLPLAAARAQFCPGASPFVFADVLASDPFCGSITFLAQRGVTLGCQVIDANNRNFCPADSVRRDQMAAFMFRLADVLFPATCAAGQMMKWSGLAWTCADDLLGGGGGGGTVTSVAASTGLQSAPNPIVGAGTLSIAPNYRLPQACAANQVPKWIGGAWTCANDVDTNAGGTVTSLSAGVGIVLAPNPVVGAGTVAADTAYLQRRVTGFCAAGSSIRQIDAAGGVVCEVDDTGPANAFVQGGNAFGATAVLGTTDARGLDIRVEDRAALRLEPAVADLVNGFNTPTPNVIGGWGVNAAFVGVIGASVGGGGGDLGGTLMPNRVTDHYGTVAGGLGNTAGDAAAPPRSAPYATVGGGRENTASGWYSGVLSGQQNVAGGTGSAVGGGRQNQVSGSHGTIAGGADGLAGAYAVVGGGRRGEASGVGAVVGGGGIVDNHAGGFLAHGNVASGDAATIPGGFGNIASGNFSFAAGRYSEAAADHSYALGHFARSLNSGAFVWADSIEIPFSSVADNTFRVRATGGVRLVTAIDLGGDYTESFYIAPSGNVAASGEISAVAFNPTSDANAKTAFADVDPRAILHAVANLPVRTWTFRKGDGARHIGPTAQDFRAAFGVGGDERTIATVDADGVALAAIQGLNAKLQEQAREIAELRAMVERLLAAR